MMPSVLKSNRFDLEAAVIPKRQVNDELRSLEHFSTDQSTDMGNNKK